MYVCVTWRTIVHADMQKFSVKKPPAMNLQANLSIT
jgi:hypothetical protein